MAELDVREGVDRETIETVANMGAYKYGWSTEIEMDYAPKGLNEDIVRLISAKNEEPEWLLEWRLAAYRRWVSMEEPHWAMLNYPEIDYQDQYYYAKPNSMAVKPKSLDEVDPKLLATYAKLGIPLKEQALLAGVEVTEERKVAVDAVFDSVSVGTTFKAELMPYGPTKFVDGQNQGGRPATMQSLKGEIEVIAPEEFASAKAVFPKPKL